MFADKVLAGLKSHGRNGQEGEAVANSLWAWQTIDRYWVFLKGHSKPRKGFVSAGLASVHCGDRTTGGGWGPGYHR